MTEQQEKDFLELFTRETEKILLAVSRLHQKVVNIEKRLERCESDIRMLDRRTAHSIIIH